MTRDSEAGTRTLALIGFAMLYGVAVMALAGGVLVGVDAGLMAFAPASAGILAFGIAGALGAALSAGAPDTVEPRLHGSLALGLVVALLTTGFVFGPVSLFVASGVPLASVATTAKLGRAWGVLVLALGLAGAVGVSGLVLLDLLPASPAFVERSLRDHPVVHVMQLASLFLGGLLALALTPAPSARPSAEPDEVEVPRQAVRTGSFSRSDLERLASSSLHEETASADATLEVQKLESLGVLAGGIAHDFNNLLMSVLGNTSIALMEVPETSDAHAPLREIEVAAKRARDLVGQLLAYAGKGSVSTAPIDLNALVREMGDLLATAIGRRATLRFQTCDAVPLVVADPTQLRQVVMNLITNAADAMSDRQTGESRRTVDGTGEIRVATDIRHVDRDELDLTLLGAACQPGVYVVFEVADQGVGMEPETLARIFDPFFTTKATGRGLGLAAVLGIVRRYGGTLEVESVRGEGTTFRLYLPFASSVDVDEDMPTENTSTARGWNPAVPGAILVVDDDPVVLRVTSRMVARLKFDVLEAPDGPSALALLRGADRPVLAVVLDMTMPGMDGAQTFAAIRAIDPHARVILTSGYSEAEIPEVPECTFLQKPYSLKQLTQALDRVLDAPVRPS